MPKLQIIPAVNPTPRNFAHRSMKNFCCFAVLASLSLSACSQDAINTDVADVANVADVAEVVKVVAEVAGKADYKKYCVTCHGTVKSPGGMGGNIFDDVWAIDPSATSISAAIRSGIMDAGMPAFGDQLSDAEIDAVTSYVQLAGSETASTPSVTPPVKSDAVPDTTSRATPIADAGSSATPAPAMQVETRTLKRDDEFAVPAVDDVPSLESAVKISDWVGDLQDPWGIQFIGEDEALITEKEGALRHVVNGELLPDEITGIPAVRDNGQGGLLDVAIDPDYAANGWVYLAFSHPLDDEPRRSMTKIIRGQIDDGAWTNAQTLFEARAEDYISARFHFGSRITFDDAGHLYFGIGDRGQKDDAQDISRPNGKIHRINRDGSIPETNPFISEPGAYGSIWSYGNRNPQGLIIHPQTGELWETEHGPRGGDELNRIERGVNYGWPEISYGINYSGTVLTPYTSKPGMAQPVSHWTPSIAVCGLDVYMGSEFPEWQGRLLIGALANQTLRLVQVENGEYVDEAIILADEGRVRDVTVGPDGAIYVALPKKIIKLEKAG